MPMGRVSFCGRWRPAGLHIPGSGTIEEALLSLARSSFAELLKQKTEEALEQRLVFQPVPPGA